jgi:transcription antitermination factor NusG
MNKVIVNEICEIINGTLKGFSGLVISADYEINEVEIQLDENTRVFLRFSDIKQN